MVAETTTSMNIHPAYTSACLPARPCSLLTLPTATAQCPAQYAQSLLSLRRLALNRTARLHARCQPATPEHPTWYTSRTPAKLHLLARLQSTSRRPITLLHRLLVDISHLLGST